MIFSIDLTLSIKGIYKTLFDIVEINQKYSLYHLFARDNEFQKKLKKINDWVRFSIVVTLSIKGTYKTLFEIVEINQKHSLYHFFSKRNNFQKKIKKNQLVGEIFDCRYIKY